MTRRLLASSLALVVVNLSLAHGVQSQEQTGTVAGPTGPQSQSQPEPQPSGSSPDTIRTEKEKEQAKEKLKPGTIEQATFGGGCFWCTEAVFQRVPGVKVVVSGYSGGNVPFPSYELVCSGTTGHAEVVNIMFDPALVSYERLLEIFWRTHNPNTPNAQGPDVGTQYRSIILYHNDKQKEAALKVYKNLKARKVLHGVVVTQIVPFQAFYAAEAYHQNYYNNHPYDIYSSIYITPKFDVFRKLAREASKLAKVKAAEATKQKQAETDSDNTPSETPAP
jgi:peptide-methionine (S)-S-oxide reductase